MKGVCEKQTKGDIIVLSGNSYHSNQTLPGMKSSSKSFHCVSFPRSFCYRCVKDLSCSELWLYWALSHGTVCSVFTAIPFLAHDVKSASRGFEISLPIQTLCMFIPLDLLFTLGHCAGNGATELSPEPLAVAPFGAEKHQIYPTLFCHITNATNALGLAAATSHLFLFMFSASFSLFSLQNTDFGCRLC